jgi:hypothetical protein
MGEGDREMGDRGRKEKLRKCMWCGEMIFVYAQLASKNAQPTSNQFL